jgi:hypothetical protein
MKLPVLLLMALIPIAGFCQTDLPQPSPSEDSSGSIIYSRNDLAELNKQAIVLDQHFKSRQTGPAYHSLSQASGKMVTFSIRKHQQKKLESLLKKGIPLEQIQHIPAWYDMWIRWSIRIRYCCCTGNVSRMLC